MSLQLFLKNAQYDTRETVVYEPYDPTQADTHEEYLLRQMREPAHSKPSENTASKTLKRMHADYDSVNQEVQDYTGLCWNCCLKGDDLYWPLVQQQSEGLKIKAVTCSFPCLIAHINSVYKHDRQKRERAMNMARYVFLARNGVQPKSVDPSPSKYKLYSYGGCMSEQSFKEAVNVVIRKSRGDA